MSTEIIYQKQKIIDNFYDKVENIMKRVKKNLVNVKLAALKNF